MRKLQEVTRNRHLIIILFGLVLLLSACGGGASSEANTTPTGDETTVEVSTNTPPAEAPTRTPTPEEAPPTATPAISSSADDGTQTPDATPVPQSDAELLITEEEANILYPGLWQFSEDAEYGEPDPSVCRDFVDASEENLWFVSFFNCIFAPDPNRTLQNAIASYPSAVQLESVHAAQRPLLFFGYQPDADHVSYDMLTVENERLYLVSITHRNPLLGVANAPSQEYIDNFLYNVLLTNMGESIGAFTIGEAAGTSASANDNVYASQYLSLTYPEGWVSVDDSAQPICQQAEITCLAAIVNPNDATNINIVRILLPGEMTAEEFDAAAWSQDSAQNKDVDVISRQEVELDGIPGIERIYSRPSSSTPGERNFIRKINAIDGRVLYQVTIWATSAEAMVQYQAEIEAMLGSIAINQSANEPDLSQIDFTDPTAVVEAIFVIAQNGNYNLLPQLCDPLGQNDGDTALICAITTEHPDEASFVEVFAMGQVAGEAAIDGDTAEVPFLFGPNGDQTETMTLIQRDGQWYLFGF